MKALIIGVAAAIVLAVVIAVVLRQINPMSAERHLPDTTRVGEAAENRRAEPVE